MVDAKAFRTFIRIISLLKSERLSVNMEQTHHKALIRSVMTYACPARELEADTYHLKQLRLKNKVPHNIGNFSKCTPVLGLHVAFNFPCVYDYVTKLCRQQAEVMQNHENKHTRICNTGQGEARHKKYKQLKLDSGQAYDRSSDNATVVA
jgi:hypothetical protein